MKFLSSTTLAVLVMASGCASTEMYTPDGYLTQYGAKQTDIEMNAVAEDCDSKYEITESARYDCFRQLVPLFLRYTPEFADLFATTMQDAKNVALGYEAGKISKESTIETLAKHREDYKYNNQILVEQYRRIISARNAREKQLARQRMGMALSQTGSTLLQQSSSDDSIDVTCTETVPGTVHCSDW
jgi:hypothetical protein